VDEKGKINLGALAPLLAPKSNRAAASMPATMRTTPVPIVRIEIAESEVIVNSRSEKFALPLAGTAVGAENYRYLMDFQTELGGPVVLSGSLTPGTGVMRLNLSADDADAAKVSRLARAFAPGADVGVRGRLKTRVSFEWDGRTAGLSAQLEAKPTSADAVAAEGSVGEAGANVVVTGGVFQVEASLGEGGDSVKLLVRDAAFTERSQTLDVQGIGGNVELTSLAPLKSKPKQRVRVARFKAGDTELTGGRVQFEVMNSQLIHVEQTQWTWLGGEVRADDFAVQAGRMSVNLVAKDLDLAQLLKTFAQGKASGEGKVSGSMVINIDGANVALGQGHLSAMRDGKLQIAEDVAKQIAPPQGNKSVQEQVGQNIAEALKNFQFISLTAEMGPEDRGRMDAKIRGRGATGAKQEITYEPRVTGLNDLLGLVLHVRSAMSAGENAGGKAN